MPSATAAAPTANKRRAALHPLPLLDEKALTAKFYERGISKQHAHSVWRYVVQKHVTDIREIPNLPKHAYTIISENFVACTSKLVGRNDSSDGSTTKLLIQLQDGKAIESVIMRYGAVELASFPEDLRKSRNTLDRPFKSNNRATLCVSSQVGCQMGCTFCATGTMGLLANLTAGEILEQLYIASRIEKIRNVVFMGMGEPLDNYEEVVCAIRGMNDARRFNLATHRITVSTVGVAPRIKKLASDFPGVSLALSLHAPNEALRLKLVPSSKAWSIKKIMEATDFFVSKQRSLTMTMSKNQVIMFEYVLIANENDSDEVAHELGKLLTARAEYVMLNVIPYNATNVPESYRPPDKRVIEGFINIIRSYNVRVTIRQELGQDISGACGQLVVQKFMNTQNGERKMSTAIHEIEDSTAPVNFLASNVGSMEIASFGKDAPHSLSSLEPEAKLSKQSIEGSEPEWRPSEETSLIDHEDIASLSNYNFTLFNSLGNPNLLGGNAYRTLQITFLLSAILFGISVIIRSRSRNG